MGNSNRVGDARRAIVLAGMPGTGKSAAGRALAARLGWAFVDLDDMIAADAGRPIGAIFDTEGEPGFRARERAAVARLASALARPTVVALGGWTVGDPENRSHLAGLGPVVCLVADAVTLAARLTPAEMSARPRLAGAGAAGVDALAAERQPVYDSLPLQVDTTGRDADAVARAVVRLVTAAGALDAQAIPVRSPGLGCGGRPTPGHAAVVAPGLLPVLGAWLEARGARGTVPVVTDLHVAAHHGPTVLEALRAAGLTAELVALPPGEATKSLATVGMLYDRLAGLGVDRQGLVLALGGGVVTDVAGFAAATYLRGVPWVAVPTSLLGMADAAIGGKTGINLPAGKNLAGAFHPPAGVAVDPAALATLPAAERRAGLAEVVKAALIADAALFESLAEDPLPAPADAAAWAALVVRAIRVKAAIVGADPRERGGRIVLNLGHTFAHALERATGYRLPHGEAVSVGLVAAAKLADRIGMTGGQPLAPRVEHALARHGLPVRWAGPDAATVVAAMAADKKRLGARLRFVLPRGVGSVAVRDDIAPDDVVAVVAALRGG